MTRTLIALLVTVSVMPATLRAADDKLTEDVGIGRPRIEIFAPSSPAARPALLPALYGALAGLQIYDGYSTLTGPFWMESRAPKERL